MTAGFSSLLLVGCGKMGGALLAGWLARGIDPGTITVVAPEAASIRGQYPGVRLLERLEELPGDYHPECILLAVKPQTLDEALPGYRERFGERTLYLSIAAGKTTNYFASQLGIRVPVIRAMPNTPALVGKGVTVLCANPTVNDSQKRHAGQLLAAVGAVFWLEDEALMDAVTAVSGSGPAYVFLLTECLAQAGEEAGLAKELAAQLARLTVRGAAELAATSDEPLDVLRRNVTSPGGTTEAALSALMQKPGLRELMREAVQRAIERSRQLG